MFNSCNNDLLLHVITVLVQYRVLAVLPTLDSYI